MELPLSGIVEAHATVRGAVLVHRLTWEIRELPGDAAHWVLAEDNGGALRLRDTAGVNDLAVGEVFETVVPYNTADDTLHCLGPDGEVVAFSDHMGQRDALEVPMSYLRKELVRVRVWRFRKQQRGSWLWWALGDGYAAANKPFDMSASQWYHS